MVSAKISAKKSGWMIVQASAGVVVGWALSKLQQKTGLTVPAELQTELIAVYMVVATGLIHGASNYVKHLLADRVVVAGKAATK